MDVGTSIVVGSFAVGGSYVLAIFLDSWLLNQTDRVADRKKLLSELEKLRTGDTRPNVEYPGR